MDDDFKVISTTECETVFDMLDALYAQASSDPRGEEVGQATAVCINNMCVQIEVRQFKDGTRAFVLSGV